MNFLFNNIKNHFEKILSKYILKTVKPLAYNRDRRYSKLTETLNNLTSASLNLSFAKLGKEKLYVTMV